MKILHKGITHLDIFLKIFDNAEVNGKPRTIDLGEAKNKYYSIVEKILKKGSRFFFVLFF